MVAQTAGPIGLKFFEGTYGYPGGNLGKTKFKCVFSKTFFISGINYFFSKFDFQFFCRGKRRALKLV